MNDSKKKKKTCRIQQQWWWVTDTRFLWWVWIPSQTFELEFWHSFRPDTFTWVSNVTAWLNVVSFLWMWSFQQSYTDLTLSSTYLLVTFWAWDWGTSINKSAEVAWCWCWPRCEAGTVCVCLDESVFVLVTAEGKKKKAPTIFWPLY